MFKKLVIRRFILGVSLFLVVVVIVFFTMQTCSKEKAYKSIAFEKQEKIANQVRYEVQPFYIDEKNTYYFEVFLESFQNQQELELDFLSSVALEDDKLNSYVPLKWEQVEKDLYTRKGILSFPELIEKADRIKLVFFGLEDVEFIWEI